jgi:hypothetical protein
MAIEDAETTGGEYLAEMTGGSMVRNANDLAGSLTRLADESSAYYLLGYQADRPRDAQWHKLEVKVSRPGATVHARRGYLATVSQGGVQTAVNGKKSERDEKKKGKDGLPTRALDPALTVGGERDRIPLRAAPYVFEMDGSGTARVLVAVEVDTRALTFGGTGAKRSAQLDVAILGVPRDLPKTVSSDSHVELGIDAKAIGGWWIFSREVLLPPGPAQIRVLVRDTSSGQSGLVAQRLEIPRAGNPYMSTPILTDRLRVPDAGRSPAKIVAIAHRRFPPHGQLYCAYEVYVAPGRELEGMPHIAGSYTLRDQDGQTVADAPATPISIALGAQIVRLFSIPLDRLAAGRYRLTIRATDAATGLDLATTEAFVVEQGVDAQWRLE